MVWACPQKPPTLTKHIAINSTEQWEAVLLSNHAPLQEEVIGLAEDAARAHGLLAAI